MDSSSWLKTLTTFSPVIVSSIKPFNSPRSFCCSTKFLPEILVASVEHRIITTTMPQDSSVSGIDRTIIITKMDTTVIMLFTSCGIDWLII